MRHCKKKFAATDRLNLILLSHSFTLDIVIHCRSQKQLEMLNKALIKRFAHCKLALNTEKTKIVYCKDTNRKEEWENTLFDFLGYTFRPRIVKK